MSERPQTATGGSISGFWKLSSPVNATLFVKLVLNKMHQIDDVATLLEIIYYV